MRFLIPLLLLAAPALAQSPCDGRITDKLNHPLVADAIAKPATGECYVDPVFGTKVCRVGNADPSEGTDAIVKTNYNSTWGWNADESLLFLWHRGGGRRYEVFEGDEPYAHVMTLLLNGSPTTGSPTDIEHVLWDVEDPHVLYYPNTYRYSGSDAPLLYKVTIDPVAKTSAQVVYRNFTTAPTNCPPESALSLGHSHDMSIDGKKIVGLSCGYNETRKFFLYSVADDQVHGIKTSPNPTMDWAPIPFLSGTGGYYEPTQEAMNLNLDTTLTLSMAKEFEHQTMGLAGTEDRLNRVNFDSPPATGSLVSISMATGAATVIVGPSTGWPYPPSGTHPSLTPRNGSGWVAVGSFGGEPLGQGVLQNEIYLGNVDTGEVCRVAHARTMGRNGPWGYWAETHPQISNDGYRVLFTSDWLGSNTVDAYVVDLRPLDITILTPSLPNAVVGESYDREVQIVGGTPPYSCALSVGTLPTGLSLVDCSVTGTPAGIETETFTIQACDTVPDCTSREFVLVTQERPEITTTSPLPDAVVGSLYSQSFAAIKGVTPLTWSTGGDTCSTSFTGDALSGTPLCLETCSFSVIVTDSHAQPISATGSFEFDVVVPAPLVFTADLLIERGVCPECLIEEGFRLERSPNEVPRSWSVLAALPAGPSQHYFDEPIGPCDDFCWRVFATRAEGDSAPSNEVCGAAP